MHIAGLIVGIVLGSVLLIVAFLQAAKLWRLWAGASPVVSGFAFATVVTLLGVLVWTPMLYVFPVQVAGIATAPVTACRPIWHLGDPLSMESAALQFKGVNVSCIALYVVVGCLAGGAVAALRAMTAGGRGAHPAGHRSRPGSCFQTQSPRRSSAK